MQALDQSISPRQLLDPRGFQSRQQDGGKKQTTEDGKRPRVNDAINERQQDTSVSQNGDSEIYGVGNMIERFHGVSDRSEYPQKRQKTEKNGELANVTFGGGASGSEISEFMKQTRTSDQAINSVENNVVDLTGGDDDDVILISDTQEKEVCFGRLESTKISAHQIPDPGNKANYLSKLEWPTMKLQLKRFPGRDNIIRVLDPTGKDFGNVDIRTAQGLSKLLDCKAPRYRVQARLLNRKKKQDQYPGAPCSEYLDMVVNLYGPRSKAEATGKFLATKMLKLLPPFAVDAGREICNPHASPISRNTPLPRTSGGTSSAASSTGFVSRTTEEIRNDVLGMFDSLQKSESLPEMEADQNIVTPLLKHQKQALHFMTCKERTRVFGEDGEDNDSLWRLRIRPNGQRMYYNVITGQEEHSKPPDVRGGILADMMGLGKSLSILSLIVHSLPDAHQWADSEPLLPTNEEPPILMNSRATLLVSPLSTVANWEEQIAIHVKPAAISYYVYHGSSRYAIQDKPHKQNFLTIFTRCRDIRELAKYDLIITTYHIVASEVSGRGPKRNDIIPLLQTNFFRIVLDEAHSIREQSTRQSQAICAMSAQRRWAVTGTPVQNRLDDLGALIKFLRIKPFHEKGGFAQYILTPFKLADPEILPKLRLLVDSITLRRLKDRIDIPDRTESIVRLKFSKDEETLYEWFAKDSDRRMRIIASENRKKLGGKSYVHILRAILRLRLICAHGRELLSEDDLKLTEGFSASNAIDLDSDEDESTKLFTNARQAYEMLMLFRETNADTCVQCAKTIGADAEAAAAGKDQTIGYMLPCYQMVCKECFQDLKQTIDCEVCTQNPGPEDSENNAYFTCPYCDQRFKKSFFELTQEGVDNAEDVKAMARGNPRHAKIIGRYGGPHTKTRALLDALEESKTESQDFPAGKPPIKSVVFSGWTTHLDLIQIALDDHKVNYVRLDGKMTRKHRAAALDAFRDDNNVTVILISIGAGGLGLNLTSGSKVYVMEPQFNPAAEAQAIDRVHRLGQTRHVMVTRFIMEGSFEEKMLNLQRKKQNLAELSMNRGKMDKAEAAKQKLEELRSLFR
ncbi:MAG: hypothetical protein Q9167_000117 [Letrouitia subvulpina]